MPKFGPDLPNPAIFRKVGNFLFQIVFFLRNHDCYIDYRVNEFLAPITVKMLFTRDLLLAIRKC